MKRYYFTVVYLQELNMVLIKLRLNVPYRDIAYRFGVSVPTVARTYLSWLNIMDIRLSH